MTNIFISATGKDLPAADRVFSVVTDMAMFRAEATRIPPRDLHEARLMVQFNMKKVEYHCYSNGAVIRW